VVVILSIAYVRIISISSILPLYLRKMPPKKQVLGKLPSSFDNCLKLDVLGHGTSDLESVLQCVLVGHPDSVSRDFSIDNGAPFAFQSVYYDAKRIEGAAWRPAYRFIVVSYSRAHKALFDQRVPLKWKCLYEVIPESRARNLYFDLEQSRPAGVSREEHDRQCWAKVKLLVRLVCDTFRYCHYHPEKIAQGNFCCSESTVVHTGAPFHTYAKTCFPTL
jgi:hypothetical protein